LRHCGCQPEGAGDETFRLQREPEQEKAAAETREPDRARQLRPKPIRHAAADQDPTNRPASIK
jgi:hypothetical protein